MARILFVEDNLPLIDELAELLQAERPGIETRFAVDIPGSLTKMNREEFDIVVLDVMLPAYPGVPAQDEGVYLAAWIVGNTDKLPAPLKDKARPLWLEKRIPVVIFLTSRTGVPIGKTWDDLTGGSPGVLIIERLRDDAYAHCLKILECIG